QLIFPENQIAQALEKAQEGNQIVFLGHHPLSWLTQPNQNRVESLIAKRGAAYLYGHVHEAKPSKKVFSSGTIFANQGGAIYQGRDKDIWAGYSFLLLERLQTEWFVKTRRWYEARRD